MHRDIRVVLREQVVSQGATRHGLVIGIEKYQNAKLNLRYVRRDAQALYDVMVAQDCGLFPKENVQLLLDEEATHPGIRRAFSKLIRDANTEDTVWIFYAGHGAVEGDETYWVTHDADIHDLFGSALPSRAISHFLTRISAKRVVTFLDCCHAEATVQEGARQVLTADEAFAAFKGEGRFTVCSCEGDQKSVELKDEQHGAFTYHLVEGLKGAADEAGQGVVLAEDLWKYLEDRVTNAARKARNPQTPRLISNVSHRLALTLNTKDLARKAELEQKLRGLYGRGPDPLTGAECDLAVRLLHQGPANDAEAPLAGQIEALAAGSPDAIRAFKAMVQMLQRIGPSQPTVDPTPKTGPTVEPQPVPERPSTPRPTAAPGLIYVEYEPPDAQVALDGQPVKLQMGQIEDVPSGEHVLRVSARYCEPFERAVTVEPGRVARLEPIRLSRGSGSVTVVSTPPGAAILVDAQDTERVAPDTVDVDAGDHTVQLQLKGFRPTEASVQVDVGQTQMVRHELKPLPKVRFESEPTGADVIISGKTYGQTPLELALDPGKHDVTFELEGHKPKTARLRCDGHKDTRLRLELEAKPRLMLPAGVVVPGKPKDKHGNPVREGEDPDSGLPLETVLDQVDMPLILCPGGPFMMGEDDEAHEVHVPAFYMAKYQVTNGEWKQFVDANRDWRKARISKEYHDGDYLEHWKGDSYPSDEADHPVVYVSWFAAKGYCEWAGGRLPTEAEWEKACRASTNTKYCLGDGESKLGEYAWYDGNSDSSTHPVGQKKPNQWGLYDMHGNVWEWCSSLYSSYPYEAEDGRDDLDGDGSRALRGGAWSDGASNARSALRYDGDPAGADEDGGFRLCVGVCLPS